MLRKIAFISLLVAWLCASGAMLDVAQVIAWGRMFAGYARTESIVKAANETFDPAKPCALCLAVCKAREASTNHTPGVPSRGMEKIVLISIRATDFVSPEMPDAWPVYCGSIVIAPSGDVPVPPPRGMGLGPVVA